MILDPFGLINFSFSVNETSGEVTCKSFDFDDYLLVPAEIKVTMTASVSRELEKIYEDFSQQSTL